MDNFILGFGSIFCLAWWMHYSQILYSLSKLTELEKIQNAAPLIWPDLNIVIAACNEESGIETAIKSLLNQDYPKLKLILVNDRSTDKTGDIVNQLGRDERVTAIHVNELPENWLGKVHALQLGFKQVDNGWVLFTDADINFKPGALKKAMSYALDGKVDHLALMPAVITNNYWLEVIIRTFGLMFLYSLKTHRLDRANTDAYIGVGAFNLVKHSILQDSAGFEWLRMEVADDVGLGKLIKEAGGKSTFAMAQDLISVEWYPSISAMFSGLEKNLFAGGAHYSLLRLITLILVMWSMIFAPFIVLLYPTPLWLNILAISSLIWLPIMAITGKIISKTDLSMGLFVPVGQFIISLMMLRSAIMCIKRGGIIWRGTLYPLKQLKKYQRIKL